MNSISFSTFFKWRGQTGSALTVLQTAVTIAILCNLLFLITQRAILLSRPSGADEGAVFVIEFQWPRGTSDVIARINGDLETLRNISGVRAAGLASTYPLSNDGRNGVLAVKRGGDMLSVGAAVYAGDEQLVPALGLKLLEGRNFRRDEVMVRGPKESDIPAAVIVTRSMAKRLFFDKTAIGQFVYTDPKNPPAQIIGIVEELQVPFTRNWRSSDYRNSYIEPYVVSSEVGAYVMKVADRRFLSTIMRECEHALADREPTRVIKRVLSLTEARSIAYSSERGISALLSFVSVALLVVTAASFYALSSWWVLQRYRQIAIRRALGATRGQILRWIQVEALIVASAGATFGVVITQAVNLALRFRFEVEAPPTWFLLIAVLVVVCTTQCGVLIPALRGARLPPAVAIRNAIYTPSTQAS